MTRPRVDAAGAVGDDIYQVNFWSAEEERPEIDYGRPENTDGIPWLRIGYVLEGERPAADYEPLRLIVDTPDALEWDTYLVAGTNGLFSKRAVDLVGPYMAEWFEFLEATINGAPYLFPRTLGTLDCLDCEHSDVKRFDFPPHRIMHIRRFAFFKDRIPEQALFRIPEHHGLLGTEKLKTLIESAGLKGFYFENAEQ